MNLSRRQFLISNGAVLATAGDLVVYVGVERLASAADTHLEIELNQDRVRVTTGNPWPVQGGRTDDDGWFAVYLLPRPGHPRARSAR